MPFAVSKAIWLQVEGDRVRDIITSPRYWRRQWTDQSLHAALNEIGLEYTLAEVQALNDEMHKRGVVTDVVTPVPGPAPVPVAAVTPAATEPVAPPADVVTP